MRWMMAAALAIVLGSAAAAQEAMTFPDAMEVLNRERLSAEQCVRVVRRHLPPGDAAALTEMEAGYEAARRDFNAMIVRLQTALVDDTAEAELATLTASAEAASEKRSAFCAKAEALIPAPDDAEGRDKNVVGDIVGAAIGEVVDAVTWFFDRRDRIGELRRKQYTTRLEDEKWLEFAKVSAD